MLEFAKLAAFRNEVIGWIDEVESFTKPADRLRVGPRSNAPLSRAQLTPEAGQRIAL